MSNYEAMSSIEKVELAETIKLPKIAKLSYDLLESGGTWESAFDKYKDTKEVIASKKMLDACGVKYTCLKDKIDV